jgi:hypothetical protein
VGACTCFNPLGTSFNILIGKLPDAVLLGFAYSQDAIVRKIMTNAILRMEMKKNSRACYKRN